MSDGGPDVIPFEATLEDAGLVEGISQLGETVRGTFVFAGPKDRILTAHLGYEVFDPDCARVVFLHARIRGGALCG